MAKQYDPLITSDMTDPTARQYSTVVLRPNTPPIVEEHILLQEMANDWSRKHVLRGTPSGWLANPTSLSASYVCNPSWSNWFKFGQQRSGEKQSIEWACVNGWMIPVTGTLTGTPPGSPNDTDTWNRVTLDPPPASAGDARVDFVFLEVWEALVQPNPSVTNKPGASALYKYGNVESGMTYLTDNLKLAELGFPTANRGQIQYRIRVVTGLLGLTTYPDGFDPTLVKARGAAATQTAFTFTNMGKELGDPGLWRAGDGTANTLGTMDGYVYAIPIATVFRRNSVAWDGDPSQNLNGGVNRNPTAVDRTGYKTFSTTPTLSVDLSAAATTFTLASVSNIPLPLAPATPMIIQINDELMTYSVITGSTATISQRGAFGSKAVAHKAGSVVRILSGAPDGLFSDQITATDIQDLRHAVNPNGFDADTLLKHNLDLLLKGGLRSTWKRSGGGPQGPFVRYQDKVSNSAASLGVTKLDGPDGIRMIWSDAAVPQPVEVIFNPVSGAGATWGLGLTATGTQGTPGQLGSGDSITIPVAQFKTGLIGGDADQVRLLGQGDDPLAVRVRIDGNQEPLPVSAYSVTPTDPTATNDLVITFNAGIGVPVTRNVYVTVQVLYGAGRGLSRRPDSVHSVAYLSGGSDIMTQLSGVPSNNIPLRAAWVPLWSKFRNAMFRSLLPVTAEAYVDPGSKTVALTPFRRIPMTAFCRPIDGTAKNINTSTIVAQGTLATTPGGGSTITDAGANFSGAGVIVNDAIVITSPAQVAGTYLITGGIAATTVQVNATLAAATPIVYSIYHTQGLMPANSLSGAVKWTTTDPLQLFSGSTGGAAAEKNLCITLPRHLVPGWGEVKVPIIHSDTTTTPAGGSATFDEGINFLTLTKKGSRAAGFETETNYIPFANGALSWSLLSTRDLTGLVNATYNGTFTFSGNTFAGIRKFTDTRGMGRQGLELPPFYGAARLFAVYEAADYAANGSRYNSTTREPTGSGATNLLRQNVSGPTYWIEMDADGDSTFVLNAECIDISKSPTVLANFAAGDYVIEANLFGFDRHSFDATREFRLVLARTRAAGQAKSVTRTDNFGASPGPAAFVAPTLCVPGPALAGDEIAINYSRTVYQGDAWGSQTNHQDIGYKPGPLTSGTAYQVVSAQLDALNLSRPNQKLVEVLASTAFSTSFGTGRLSGDSTTAMDPRNVGWENVVGSYPPASGVAARPRVASRALTTTELSVSLGTEYHGCTERLPLGSLWRDKDFRGTFVSGADPDGSYQTVSPLVYKTASPGVNAAAVSRSKSFDQDEILCSTVSLGSGQAGELLVHVDGEQGNYGLTTNFRTNRGGSCFAANGSHPGGEVATILGPQGTHPSSAPVLHGIAMLVRNTPTSIGAAEVSAGSELMLVVVTTAQWMTATRGIATVACGTNGTGEGHSAADLYHISGRPLVVDHSRPNVNPNAIILSPASPLI